MLRHQTFRASLADAVFMLLTTLFHPPCYQLRYFASSRYITAKGYIFFFSANSVPRPSQPCAGATGIQTRIIWIWSSNTG